MTRKHEFSLQEKKHKFSSHTQKRCGTSIPHSQQNNSCRDSPDDAVVKNLPRTQILFYLHFTGISISTLQMYKRKLREGNCFKSHQELQTQLALCPAHLDPSDHKLGR